MRRSQHQSDEATDGEMRLIALHEQGIHTVSVKKGIDRVLKLSRGFEFYFWQNIKPTGFFAFEQICLM